jgi:hypothetical protein
MNNRKSNGVCIQVTSEALLLVQFASRCTVQNGDLAAMSYSTLITLIEINSTHHSV